MSAPSKELLDRAESYIELLEALEDLIHRDVWPITAKHIEEHLQGRRNARSIAASMRGIVRAGWAWSNSEWTNYSGYSTYYGLEREGRLVLAMLWAAVGP